MCRLFIVCVFFIERLAQRLTEVNNALKLEIVRISNQLSECGNDLQEEITLRRLHENKITTLETENSKRFGEK